MAPGRTPEQALAELGEQLDAAFRSAPERRWWSWRSRAGLVFGRRRALALVAAVAVLGVSSAAATNSLFSSSPPAPLLAPLSIDVAKGTVGDEGWTLSLSRCSRPTGAVSVVLRAGSGGSGTGCGAIVQTPGVYYDPQRGNALAFGLLPAGTQRIELVLGAQRVNVKPSALNNRARVAAGVPAGTLAYITVLPAHAVLTALAAFSAAGHVTFVCQLRSCTRP
jgi:hypothetical protein